MCDLNTATLQTLTELPGVDVDMAYAIQLWRPYFAWGDVEQIPGLDWERVDAFRNAGADLGPTGGAPVSSA